MTNDLKKTSFIKPNYVSLFILGLVVVVFYFIVKDYLVVLVTSSIFTILVYPIYKRIYSFYHYLEKQLRIILKKVFKGREFVYKPEKFENLHKNLSAISTLILVLASVVIIFNILVGLFSKDFKRILVDAKTETQSLLDNPQAKTVLSNVGLNSENLSSQLNSGISFLEERKLPQDVNFADLYNSEGFKNTQDSLIQFSQNLLSSLVRFIFNTVIFLISSFFFLISGPQILKKFYFFLPFTEDEENQLSKDTVLAVKNVIIGNILSGLLNAIAVYLICFVFQLPYTLLLVLLAFLIGFLPLSPSEFAYIVPIFLVYSQNPGKAFLVAILAELYILFLNYIVVPRVIASTSVSPLMILLATFAFIGLFGIMGFIIGPIAVYIIFSLLKIVENRKKQIQD